MSGSCAVRGKRFAQPCRKSWLISPGPSCSSEPHSSLPGPASPVTVGHLISRRPSAQLSPPNLRKHHLAEPGAPSVRCAQRLSSFLTSRDHREDDQRERPQVGHASL